MKKSSLFVLFLVAALIAGLFGCKPSRSSEPSRSAGGQQDASIQPGASTPQNVTASQKFALVIGNGAYTGITKLNNPVNDANDVSAALRGLGFTVDTLTNAGRAQMEEAVARMQNRLAGDPGSYGFFFYAGHGVQSNGENYLIPVDANIPSETYLRDRALPMQAVLGELNDAGNTLNIVVLDACRDNPYSWGRSGSRGLQVVSGQPADSIIVYATSAGATAADGTGRNGLFTTHLLNNLKTPGISVQEVFNRTGADVRRASGGSQIPAVYSQFFETAWLGGRPAVAVQPSPAPVQPAPKPSPAPVQPAPAPVVVQPNPAPAPTPARSAKSYFDSGETFLSRGDYVTAIEEYTQAIRLDPNYAVAYHKRGWAYDDKGDYDRAIADCTQAIRLDPNYADAYNVRGVAYRNKGDYDRAIADYTQAIRLDPNYAKAYNNRGAAYYYKMDYDRAIADCNQAIRLDPNDASAYYNRGNAYNNKKDYDRAIADYTQAIRLDPNYKEAYHNRGAAYYYKKDYDRAIAEYTQAIRLDPNHAMAYSNRGNAYNNRGNAYNNKKDYDRAIADCTQAIRLDPNYAKAYNNRGLAYCGKGDYDRAIADFEAALRIEPNYPDAETGLKYARQARGY
jgi:tetratricopeptide (TPR) repeat protein